jgi:hypothetical protein
MNIHKKLSNYFFDILDTYYYKNLQKIYNTSITEVLNNIYKINIIKPEVYIYTQYYFIFLLNKSITTKSYFLTSIFLHGFYIMDKLSTQIITTYQYNNNRNINYLKKTSYILFYYSIYFKILFSSIYNYQKFTLLTLLSTYYILMNVNYVYKKRIEYIKNKNYDNNDENRYFSKILIITSNIDNMNKIIKYTNIFNYSLFLGIINLSLFFIY